jgi:N-acetylneuraminate synthase
MIDSKVEIIAEIAQAHDGSLGIAHSYIDVLAETGVDTVKFQMHIADAESSEYEQFRVNFSYEDNTRYGYWERMEFTLEQWEGLKKHCEDKGLGFLCSPFSVQAVEWLEKINTSRYKIASGEISNYLMLDKICKTGKPILLSSGMSSYNEISDCIQFISQHSGKFVGVFQCTTSYPTPPEKYGLNVLQKLKEITGARIGLSDHSGEIYAPLAAVALGAEMLEMHVVFDKKMFGPDAASSLTPSEFKTLCTGVRKLETAFQNPVDKNNIESFSELKRLFGKSLAVNRNLEKGHTLKISDLESKKPGDKGISANLYQLLIGKKLNKDLVKNSFIQNNDLE